jgi:hypothetical protein
MIFLICLGLGSVALAATLATMIRPLCFRQSSVPVTTDWIAELSVERYRPMLRVLQDDDFEFLRSQPGYTRQMEAILRRQRCEIFDGYLRSLTADFGRVCVALKVVMAQSDVDRPDLASVLLHQQVAFACGLVNIHCHLVLYRWGLNSVNVAEQLKLFDAVRLQLQTLVPAQGWGVA